MAGYPSNLAKKFSPTEQFPQHILPLLRFIMHNGGGMNRLQR